MMDGFYPLAFLFILDHKHIKDKIISSEIPDIEQVILEIITDYLS